MVANFPENVVENLPKDVTTGIYYGWAQVDSGEIHKMVMSIGWNPYYKNEKKSMVNSTCTKKFTQFVLKKLFHKMLKFKMLDTIFLLEIIIS